MAKILINNPYKNIDEVSLSDNIGASLIDGYIDEGKGVNRRPGLGKIFCDLGVSLPVDGLYLWEEQGYIIAVADGRVWKIGNNGSKTEITGDTLKKGKRPTFATNGTTLAITNGGRIITTTGETSAYITDGNAPVESTYVTYMDMMLIANNIASDRFYWSGYNSETGKFDLTTWNALNFATAEKKPDEIIAIHAGWQEILLVGRKTIEFWINDNSTFVRLEGVYVNRGCSAPDTFKKIENTWFWLDDERRLVKLNGRTPIIISTPFNKEIQNFSTVEDAMADVINIEGKTFYLLYFPSEEKTLVYDYTQQAWQGEWRHWNEDKAEYEQFLGNCHCYAWGKHLIGDRRIGLIYELSSDYTDDNGTIIRTLYKTGHIGFGTLKRKRAKNLTIRVKKGIGNTNVNEPMLMIKWRNNNNSKWSQEKWISLGKVGEYDFIGRLSGYSGIFRNRQYEFTMTDNAPLILIDAETDIELLR